MMFRSGLVACCLAVPLLLSTAQARVVGRVFAYAPAGQATVKIEVTGGPIIYIDPTGFTTSPADADFILLTHNHGDHQSNPVITRVRKTNTVIVSSPPGVPALQQGFPGTTILPVTPGQKLTLGGVEVETVPMYNIVKNGHPRVMNFVGYVVNVGGVRVYQAGDTERVPEMKTFAVDVAMLPLGQTFTMNSVQEAADAALDLKARVAIPIHWGLAEGTLADANQFASLLSGKMTVMVNTPAEGFPPRGFRDGRVCRASGQPDGGAGRECDAQRAGDGSGDVALPVAAKRPRGAGCDQRDSADPVRRRGQCRRLRGDRQRCERTVDQPDGAARD